MPFLLGFLLPPIVAGILGFAARNLLERFVASYKPRVEDYELWLVVMHRPVALIGPADVRQRTSLTIGGKAVIRPYVVTIYLWSGGRKDIEPSQFAGDAPLRIRLTSPVIEVLREGTRVATRDGLPIAIEAGGELRFGPGVLKRDFAVVQRLLVEGAPEFAYESVPLNVNLRQVNAERAKAAWRERLRPWFGRVAVVATLALAFVPAWTHGTFLLPALIGIAVFLVLGAVAWTYPVEPPTVARAVQLLRDRLQDQKLLSRVEVLEAGSFISLRTSEFGAPGEAST